MRGRISAPPLLKANACLLYAARFSRVPTGRGWRYNPQDKPCSRRMMTQLIDATKLKPNWRNISNLVLSAGFGLTGAGTVMLGVLLPTLSEKWGLRDDSAGFLLFLQFFGSALGATLTGANRNRSLIGGYGLLAVSTFALAFTGLRASFAVFFFFGLGLGMAMTSTSLLVSDRCSGDRAAKLEGLNFAWSAGATAGPMFFLPFLHNANLRSLFFTMLGLFLLMFTWMVSTERSNSSHNRAEEPRAALPASPRIFLTLVILAICAVGVEASLSGWLTTYSHRAGLRDMAGATLATTLFWFGGMLSRLAFSTTLMAKTGRRVALQITTWGIVATIVALIATTRPSAILVVSALAGLSIGPIYPLLLSFLLERSARGWIFAVAGMGAAIFPWLTGLLSARFGSLRYGLLAPCGAAMLMIALLKVAHRSAELEGLPALTQP
jgi:FHS family glucose/mannose:H+ symporter-like MFS transporter